jgi:hypothetical protein
VLPNKVLTLLRMTVAPPELKSSTSRRHTMRALCMSMARASHYWAARAAQITRGGSELYAQLAAAKFTMASMALISTGILRLTWDR